MAKELNPRDEMARRQEESRRKLEKEGPDESPIDQERVKLIERFLDDPTAYLKQAFIDSQYQPRDVVLLELILLARIAEKLH